MAGKRRAEEGQRWTAKLKARKAAKDAEEKGETYNPTPESAEVRMQAVAAAAQGYLQVGSLMQLAIGCNQFWSLTQFYSVDFSQSRIGVKSWFFDKCTIKVCVSCI